MQLTIIKIHGIMAEIHVTKSWYRVMALTHGIDSWNWLMVQVLPFVVWPTHYHSSHINTCQYLEDVKWLTMRNPLHATSIDGQNAVTLLDSSVPVRRAASKYLVNLKWRQIIFIKQVLSATTFTSALQSWLLPTMRKLDTLMPCWLFHHSHSFFMSPLHFINFCFNEPFKLG